MSIDLWDIETLPPETKKYLVEGDDLLAKFCAEEIAIESSRPTGRVFWQRPANKFAQSKAELEADIGYMISGESIRCFHYARMTDEEIDLIGKRGIVLSSAPFLKERLDGLVAAQHINRVQADQIYAASPLMTGELYGRRDGLFWTCAIPQPVSDSGVERLLRIWGGEVASWTLVDAGASFGLAGIGKPRILEIEIPISTAMEGRAAGTIGAWLVARRMVDLGLSDYQSGIDVYTDIALPPDALLTVHTEGDENFMAMANGYPSSYSN
ncbi:hypothetical protein EFD56_21565 [Rhizobium phaseoli]|uniref:hypothetical protein n=1 Tax=Rhizobium phaseoli TaxID=396 RepID=UPI000F89779E|nr:hypothetical protein [Rhizobium phaseoli]RUM16898.1 hypothetical protein EFD56_21565 [Rhizobium phaseoli]